MVSEVFYRNQELFVFMAPDFYGWSLPKEIELVYLKRLDHHCS